jgi:hypothetical protein
MRAVAQRDLILGLSLAQLITWGSVFYTFALLIGPIEQELGINRAAWPCWPKVSAPMPSAAGSTAAMSGWS